MERVRLRNVETFNPEEMSSGKEFIEQFKLQKMEESKIGEKYDEHAE